MHMRARWLEGVDPENRGIPRILLKVGERERATREHGPPREPLHATGPGRGTCPGAPHGRSRPTSAATVGRAPPLLGKGAAGPCGGPAWNRSGRTGESGPAPLESAPLASLSARGAGRLRGACPRESGGSTSTAPPRRLPPGGPLAGDGAARHRAVQSGGADDETEASAGPDAGWLSGWGGSEDAPDCVNVSLNDGHPRARWQEGRGGARERGWHPRRRSDRVNPPRLRCPRASDPRDARAAALRSDHGARHPGPGRHHDPLTAHRRDEPWRGLPRLAPAGDRP